MKVRPISLWWFGVALFAPSIALWSFVIGISASHGTFNPGFDRVAVFSVYLPLVAAVVGIGVPIVCLHCLNNASWKVTRLAFSGYLSAMLVWGSVDVRSGNYQVGGHDYPNGPLADGHSQYWHFYVTWYFFPYKLIERQI